MSLALLLSLSLATQLHTDSLHLAVVSFRLGGVGLPYKAPRATAELSQREGGSSSWIPGDQRLEEWAASHACPGSSDYTHGLTCTT